MPEKLIDIKGLSRRLSTPTGTLYNRVNQQTIPFYKIGNALRFDYEEVILSLRHFPISVDKPAPGSTH